MEPLRSTMMFLETINIRRNQLVVASGLSYLQFVVKG